MKTQIVLGARAAVLAAVLFAVATGQEPEIPVDVSVPAPEGIKAASARLAERVKAGDAAGFAVALVRDGKVVWEQGTGWADSKAGQTFTSRTPIAIASISKSLTAAGIDVLVSRGRVDPASAVSKYLGKGWSASHLEDRITVAHLLKQTSGIPHLFQYEFPDEPGSVLQREPTIKRYGFSVSEPGRRFIYTNLGYSVLASVVAKAGAGSFEDVMERELFVPLEMRQTSLHGWMWRDGAAKGYGRDGSALEFPFRLGPDGGAGFFSTAHDLALYSLFQLGSSVPKGYGQVPITAYLEREKDAEPFAYDRGWGIVKSGGRTYLISDGQMSGSSTAIVLVPEESIAVVVLCNRTGGPALEVVTEILEAAKKGLGEHFKEALSSAEEIVSRASELPYGEFQGHILNEGSRIPIRIRKEDEKFILNIRGADVELRNRGWDRGALQLIALTGLEKDTGDDELRRLVFSISPAGDALEGFVLDELYNDRPRCGLPHKVELQRSKKE